MLKHYVVGRMCAAWWVSAFALSSTAATLQAQVEGVSAKNTVPTAVLIQTTLRQRVAQLPKIDEVRASDMPGLFEVRIDQQVFYTDAQANFLIRGELIDTRSMRNLTQERIAKLTAIDFAQLPLKDALEWRNGQPKHRLAIFADPNCGYCKRLEQELQKLKDVVVYTFLTPILGEDSQRKALAIWCSKDGTQAWRNWMLQGQAPEANGEKCASPLERNAALAEKLRIQGTPAIFFEDGSRTPGLMRSEQIQAFLEGRK